MDCFASLAMTFAGFVNVISRGLGAKPARVSSPGLTGDPVRRGVSVNLWRLWNAGCPGQAGA
jgi:hypothetical protein